MPAKKQFSEVQDDAFDMAVFPLDPGSGVFPVGLDEAEVEELWQATLHNTPYRLLQRIPHSPLAAITPVKDSEPKSEHPETILDKTLDVFNKVQSLGQYSGMGAIHSLNQGKAMLSPPLFYSCQNIDDEVVVGIEELRIYGVGATESEALQEMKDDLWLLFQDLEQTPVEELGPHLVMTQRVLQSRVKQDAMDA